MAREQSYNTAYEDAGDYVDPMLQAIRDYLATNPSPGELAAAMAQYSVSAEQISQATGYTTEQVNTYVAPAQQEIDYAAQQREEASAPVAQPVVPEAVESAPVVPPVQQATPTTVVESAPVVPERVQYGAPPTTQATTAATTTTTTTPPTVAQVTTAIDAWQTANPGATSQQLAIAIKNGMGLTPEVTQALATKYNMSTTDIAASYNDLISKPVTPATSVLPPTVAQVTTAIDKWSTDNPGATPQQLAIAIKNGMGLTPEVTQALATKYNMSTADVTTNFNTLVSQPVVPPTTTTTPTTTAPTVAQVRTAIDTWSTANPDATQEQLATAIKNGMGMTDTVAQALAEKYNSTPAAVVESYNRALDPYAGVTVADYQGKTYDAKTLIALASQVAQNLDTSKSSGGVFSTKGQSVGFNYNDLTSAYGGKTFTAGDQVAFDMARSLLNQGITDYDQVKNAKMGTLTADDGEGGTYTYQALVNPATGKEINAQFGYTATGSGGTEYYIDPGSGKVFTKGISSSDVSPGMRMALSIGASFLVPGISAILAAELGIGSAAATALANAGLGLAMGGDPKSVLLSAGLSLSGVGGSIDKALMTKLSAFAGDSFAGLSGTTLDDALVTASDAIKRAGTNFLLTGDTTSALTAAAGSVINSVVTGATDSKALGAGAAAYVQTGSLSTAATVGLSTAAYQAGLTYQTDAVDLFNGAKNSLLQTTVANQLTTAGITAGDVNSLVEDDLQSTIGDNGIVVTGTAGSGNNIPNLGTQVITASGGNTKVGTSINSVTDLGNQVITAAGNTKINTTIGSVPDLGTQVITATGNTKVGNAINSVTDLGTQVITANGNVKVGNAISSVTDLGTQVITANGNVKVGNTISDVTDLGTVTVVGNRYVGPNITLPDFTSNVIVSGNILGNVANVTSNVANVASNVVTLGNTVTVFNTPNNQANVSTPITTTIGGSNITPLKFASGGLNPGYIAPTPFYNTTDPAQSKFYWGSHPYQTGGPTGQVFDPVLYNTVPEAPRVPFGSQTANQNLTSAQIAAIVANPGSNNSQQQTQQASTFVPAAIAPPPAPVVVPQPVYQPAPVAPPEQMAPAPVQQPADKDFFVSPEYQQFVDSFNGPMFGTLDIAYSPYFGQQGSGSISRRQDAAYESYLQRIGQQPGYGIPAPVQQPVYQPAPVAPVYEPPAPVQQPVYQAPPAPVQQPVYQPAPVAPPLESTLPPGTYLVPPSELRGGPAQIQLPPAPVQQPAPKTQEQINAEVGEWRRSMGLLDPVQQPNDQYLDGPDPIPYLQSPVSQPVAPTPAPGLPAWMPPGTTTTIMPNGATGYNINGMIYDQTGSIISSGVGPVAP